MGNREFWKKFAAGLFFIACIGLIVAGVFVVGIHRGLTEQKFEMTALFRRVGGLQDGAPVRLSGVTVGTVKDMGFLDHEVDGRGVWVKMTLFKKYEKQVHKATDVAIITQGILGDKLIEITTSPHAYVANLQKPVIGDDPLDVKTLTSTFEQAADSLMRTSRTFDSISEQLNDLAGSARRLLNRIEERVINGTLFKVF